MNYNAIIRPFSEAVHKTKGIPMPTEPKLLLEKDRRFLFEMVMSEVGEYVLAKDEADRIDAICDAAIYITDTCLRFGIEPNVYTANRGTLTAVYDSAQAFLNATTIREQNFELDRLLSEVVASTHRDLAPFIEEVARANNQKIKDDGTVEMNGQGKVLKPADFLAPNIQGVLDGL